MCHCHHIILSPRCSVFERKKEYSCCFQGNGVLVYQLPQVLFQFLQYHRQRLCEPFVLELGKGVPSEWYYHSIWPCVYGGSCTRKCSYWCKSYRFIIMSSLNICLEWIVNHLESWKPFGTPSILLGLLFPVSLLNMSWTEAWVLNSSHFVIWETFMETFPPCYDSCGRSVCSAKNHNPCIADDAFTVP